MPRDGTATKEAILAAAHSEVLKRGFSGTSVDDIQSRAGISRGTFFYHFPSKDDLARALIQRYDETDRGIIDRLMDRAERLSSDPLQQALLYVALNEEFVSEESPDEAGCLFASYSYEAGIFDADTHEVIRDSIAYARGVLGKKLEAAMSLHPPKVPDVDPYVLADQFYAVFQGAFVLRRSLGDPSVMARQLREYRRYLELLFNVTPAVDAAAP